MVIRASFDFSVWRQGNGFWVDCVSTCLELCLRHVIVAQGNCLAWLGHQPLRKPVRRERAAAACTGKGGKRCKRGAQQRGI